MYFIYFHFIFMYFIMDFIFTHFMYFILCTLVLPFLSQFSTMSSFF